MTNELDLVCLHAGKASVKICCVRANFEICGINIYSGEDYTGCLVLFGERLKYGREIYALQVQESFHIV